MTYPCTIYRICLFCTHLKTTLHIAVQTSYRHLAGTDGLYCTLFVLYQKLSLFINSQGRSLPGLIRIKNTDRLIPVCQKLIIFFHHSGKAAGPDKRLIIFFKSFQHLSQNLNPVICLSGFQIKRSRFVLKLRRYFF